MVVTSASIVARPVIQHANEPVAGDRARFFSWLLGLSVNEWPTFLHPVNGSAVGAAWLMSSVQLHREKSYSAPNTSALTKSFIFIVCFPEVVPLLKEGG